MNDTIATQIYSLVIFTISGIAIGVFFDIFRILRRSFKTSDLVTYIEDILFWIISGTFFLYVLFKFNNGQIRNYVIIGLFLGIAFYILAISKYFIKISVKAIEIIKKILLYPIRIIISILKKLLKPLSFIVINIRKSIKDFYKKSFFMTKKVKKS